MKKSWIKTLLIVVMAMLLVFTLFACDKNKGNTPVDNNQNEEPVQLAAADYFTELWELTSEIGSDEIGEDDDLAVELGLQLAVNTRNAASDAIVQQIDLGLDVQAVVGRTEDTADHTALKVKLYDPSDAEHSEILALYLLGNDLDNLYIDFGGKHIKLEHELVTTVYNEVMGKEGGLVDLLPGALDLPLMGENSVNDILAGVTEGFGDTWNLNVLISSVARTFGLDLEQLLSGFSDIIGIFLPEDASLFDENHNMDLISLLASDVAGTLFVAEKTENGAVTNYKAALNDGLLGVAIGLIDGMLNGTNDNDVTVPFSSLEELQAYEGDVYLKNSANKFSKANSKQLSAATEDSGSNYYYGNFYYALPALNLVSNLFGDNANNREIALSFNEKDDTIQDFTISVKLGGLATGIGAKQIVPEIAITIDSLKLAKANDTNKVQITPADYKTTVALDEQLSFEVSGITLADFDLDKLFGGEDEAAPSEENTDPAPSNDVVLNHRVELGVQGQLDLVGGKTKAPAATTSAEATAKETNATQLYVYLRVVDLKDGSVTNLIHASYANGKLAAKVEPSIAAVVVKTIKGMLHGDDDLDGVSNLYWDLGEEFNFADFVHGYVVKLAQRFVPEETANVAATTVARPQDSTLTNIFNLVKKALPYVKAENGLEIKVEDVLKTVVEFSEFFIQDKYIGFTSNADVTAFLAENQDNKNLVYKKNGKLYVKATAAELETLDENEYKNYYRFEEKWTVANREDFIINLLNNPPLDPDDYTMGELIWGVVQSIMDSFQDDNMAVAAEESAPSAMDCALTILYKLAQYVRIDGVEAPAKGTYYNAAIKEVLHGTVSLKADAQDGFHLSVKATVADAHITIAEKLEATDTSVNKLTDLYAEYDALVKGYEELDAQLAELQAAQTPDANAIKAVEDEMAELEEEASTWFDVTRFFNNKKEDSALKVAGKTFEVVGVECADEEIRVRYNALLNNATMVFSETTNEVSLVLNRGSRDGEYSQAEKKLLLEIPDIADDTIACEVSAQGTFELVITEMNAEGQVVVRLMFAVKEASQAPEEE